MKISTWARISQTNNPDRASEGRREIDTGEDVSVYDEDKSEGDDSADQMDTEDEDGNAADDDQVENVDEDVKGATAASCLSERFHNVTVNTNAEEHVA